MVKITKDMKKLKDFSNKILLLKLNNPLIKISNTQLTILAGPENFEMKK